MFDLRPFNTLGHADHGWLNARHHFSFSSYQDPARTNWGALRVWNDDTIAAHTGFARHGHRDMEIITYVREGAITHRDSLNHEGRTEAGDVQVMSAGKGILHEEQNEESVSTTLFQIWIIPQEAGGAPYWEKAIFPRDSRANQLVTLASGRNAEIKAGDLPIRQDAALLGAQIDAGHSVTFGTTRDRFLYLVASAGRVLVNGIEVNTRDGLAITGEEQLIIEAVKGEAGADVVLVDAPELR